MKNGLGFTILIALFIVLAVGCTKRPTRVDMFYGTSYQLAKESQINNPDAGIHAGPPVGLEGAVASKVIERYEKGFEKPAAKTESYSINVGGMTKK
jgi:hypothetical protein